jgi:hypothetical protein
MPIASPEKTHLARAGVRTQEPHMRMQQIVAAIVWLTAGLVPSAQIVRQGGAEDSSPTAFHSSMIVDTVFAAADRSLWNRGNWFTAPEYEALGKYSCDGVLFHGNFTDKARTTWVPGIEMKAKNGTGNTVEVTIRLHLFNPSDNHDKEVTVVLEVLNGTEVAATNRIGPKDVEDKNHDYPITTTMIVPADSLKQDPMTKLRITLTTKDN